MFRNSKFRNILRSLRWSGGLLILSLAFAARANAHAPLLVTPVEPSLSVEQISFQSTQDRPETESMGLLGAAFHAKIFHELSLGLETYVSVSGRRGGFIVLGVGARYAVALTKSLALVPAFYVGGGGGGSAPQGGGLMLRPGATVQYRFKTLNLGAGYDLVRFPSGEISSHQPSMQIGFPTDFVWTNASCCHEFEHKVAANPENQLVFERLSLRPSAKVYALRGKNNQRGLPLPNRAELVGLSVDTKRSPSSGGRFTYAEAFGAVSRQIAGYMSLAAGIGYAVDVLYPLTISPIMSIGTAGGGEVPTGGGFTAEPGVRVDLALTPAWSLGAGAGYLFAPSGNFAIPTLSTGLVLNTERLTMTPRDDSSVNKATAWKPMDLRASYSVSRYGLATTERKKDVELFGFALDVFLNQYLFGTIATDWAFEGGAGGYADGLFGGGLRYGWVRGLSLEARFDAGAGAGGGLNVGSGGMLKGQARINWQFQNGLGVYGAGGRVRYIGGVTANQGEVGLSFAFGLPMSSL